MGLTTFSATETRSLHALGPRRLIVAGVLLVASGLYFVAEIVVASRWPRPYSWTENMISDLGVPECLGHLSRFGATGSADRFICSPWHPLMNVTFVVVGAAGIGAAVALAPAIARPWNAIVVGTATVNGIANACVGLFPGSAGEFPGGPAARVIIHPIAAYAEHATGMVLMAVVIWLGRRHLALWLGTAVAFILSGIAALIILRGNPVGAGGTERGAIDPFFWWRVALGCGMLVVALRWRFRPADEATAARPNGVGAGSDEVVPG